MKWLNDLSKWFIKNMEDNLAMEESIGYREENIGYTDSLKTLNKGEQDGT